MVLRIQLLFVLLVCGTHVVSCSLNGNLTDRLSLLDFKKAISDPQQALISWNDSNDMCSWHGVLCSVKHPQRVTSLNLTHQGLIGRMHPSLGNLTFLKILDLAANSFIGEIPSSLGQLHHLQNINLDNNTLQGRVPSLANCSGLKVLRLYKNQLDGQIPADLPNSLQKLAVGSNRLTGTIPASLANITTLKIFGCEDNNIEGSIPSGFAKLLGLQILYVGLNKLSGRFPEVILNLSNLVAFDVSINNFSGDVPVSVGNSLPNLQVFELGGNFFYGRIPSGLTNASRLYKLDMSSNSFTGVVPSSIGKLSRLSWLDLQLNILHARDKQDWEFMNSLANCTELQLLSIGGNHLEGTLPNSIGNLSSQLLYLYLTENQLSGDFPSGIRNLHNLISLSLYKNKFTGVLPEWLGTLKSLQQLSLDYNSFTGLIPPSVSNLTNLLGLYLDSNQLEGHIPPSIKGLQVLEALYISNNNLRGHVPMEIFFIPTIREVRLSSNKLDALLPIEIDNAKQLEYLDLSSNNISGYIPSTLGNCASLEEVHIAHNSLSGSIPTSLGKIASLKVLNLSHNNLSGLIPVSLGNLQFVQQLDFSFNHLKGDVPTKGVFGNASALRIDGNLELCGGSQGLHLPPCYKVPLNSRKQKHSTIQKLVIPLASIVLLAILIVIIIHQRGKQKENTMAFPSVISNEFPKVSYSDLSRATEGFSTSNLIGKGRYSSVFQGKLFEDRTVVAIKVLTLGTKGAHKSFISECNALRNLRHRNLIPIKTACSSIDHKGNDFKALVYEFMPRGDLHALLYSNQDDENTPSPSSITLARRLSIVVDVADALEYLHHSNNGTIVHCDLKPSNILLDENLTAHVGDFGLASFKIDSTASSGDSVSTSSIAIKGTIGYVPPESAEGGGVSTAGDVYSFGIVLLEMFLRKRPTDDMFANGLSIAKFEANFPDRILEIVDPELLEEQHDFSRENSLAMNEKSLDCLLSALSIGLQCVKVSPNERMDMKEVAAKLHGIKEAFLRGNIGSTHH